MSEPFYDMVRIKKDFAPEIFDWVESTPNISIEDIPDKIKKPVMGTARRNGRSDVVLDSYGVGKDNAWFLFAAR